MADNPWLNLQKQYLAQQQDIGNKQQAQAAQMEQQIAQARQQEAEPDMRSLAAFGEWMSGSHPVLSQFIKRSESPQEREARINQMQNQLADYQMKAGKSNLDALGQALKLGEPPDPLDKAIKEARLGALNRVAGEKAKGRPLPAPTVLKIAEGQGAIGDAKSLLTTIKANQQLIGPVTGLGALNPYSTEQKQLQADVDRVKQRVGKFLEGGVLRKEDEAKYKKILAKVTDEPSVAIYKLNNLIREVEELSSNQIKSLGKAGYDVGGLVGEEAKPEVTDAQMKEWESLLGLDVK